MENPAHSEEPPKVTHLDRHAIRTMVEMEAKDLKSAQFVVQVIKIKTFSE